MYRYITITRICQLKLNWLLQSTSSLRDHDFTLHSLPNRNHRVLRGWTNWNLKWEHWINGSLKTSARIKTFLSTLCGNYNRLSISKTSFIVHRTKNVIIRGIGPVTYLRQKENGSKLCVEVSHSKSNNRKENTYRSQSHQP